jgi:hypothetical protein
MSLAVLCNTRGTLPPSKWKAMLPTRSQAGGRPAVGVTTTFRRKTGPWPRVFRLAAPVGVGKTGRRVVFICARAAVGYNWHRRVIACTSDSAEMTDTGLITRLITIVGRTDQDRGGSVACCYAATMLRLLHLVDQVLALYFLKNQSTRAK